MSNNSWSNPLSWFPRLRPIPIGNGYSSMKRQVMIWNGREIYFNLDTSDDYKNAYNSCSPLKAVITKRAQMFVNGKIEILNKNTGKRQRGQKAKLLRDLLRQPNIFQSWRQFFAQMHTYIDLFGYCPILRIEPAGMEGQGEITSMWCIPPWVFSYELTGNWKNQTEKKGIYKGFSLEYKGKKTPLDISSICMILDNQIGSDFDNKLFIPDSRIKSCEPQISNIVAAYMSRNTLITKKGAIGILSNEGKDPSGPINLKPGAKDEIQSDFRRYGMTGQEWQVIITDASLKWQSMTFPTKDLMLFEEVEDDILRICDQCGLYPDIMGSIKKSTFANLQEAKKAQYQDFIMPDAEGRIEQLSDFIFENDPSTFLHIDFTHIEVLQQSVKDSATATQLINQAYESLYNAGLVTRGQWAEAASLDSSLIPDADKYIFERADTTPLAIKLGVGGLQALQALLQSVMPAEQKQSCLEILFGIAPDQAKRLAGSDIITQPQPPSNDPTSTNPAASKEPTGKEVK